MKLIKLGNLSFSRVAEWGAVVLVAATVIGNTGLWPMPNLSAQFLVSQNLTHNPFPDPLAQYLFTNYLQPAIFGILGGESIVAYGIYAAFVSLLVLVIFGVWFIKYHGKAIAIDEFKLFPAIVFPVFMIPFYWVGMDGMTCLLMLLTMMSFTSRWSVFWAVLLGMQHFQQGIVGFTLLAGTLIAAYIHGRNTQILSHLWRVGLIGVGIIFGKVLLGVWFVINDVDLVGDRVSYLRQHFDLFVSMWLEQWPLILWTFLGAGWLIVLRHVVVTWPFLFAVFGAFLLTPIVGDQTRVGVIVLFPSLFYWVLMNKVVWEKTSSLFGVATLALYLIVPVAVVWGGAHIGNLWVYDSQVIRQVINSDFKVESFDWLRPFKPKSTSEVTLGERKYFKADALPSRIGKPDDQGNLKSVGNDAEGFLSFGPYMSLDKGHYWGIFAYSSQGASDSSVGWIDVTLNQGTTVVAKKAVFGTGGKLEIVGIPFSFENTVDGVEVRFWVNGSAPVSLSSLEILRNN